MAIDLRQKHFRFGIEELLEATHGWYAAEDTNTSIAVNTTFLLRFSIQEQGGTAAANMVQQFQYNKNGAGWNNITTSSAVCKAVVSVAFTNGQDCTKRLSGTGTFESSAAGCTEDGNSGGNSNDIAASGNSETEAALQIVGTDVAQGDTIQFRVTVSGGTTTITYDVTPTLTVPTDVSVSATGQSMTASLGTVTVTADANTTPAGVSMTASLGTVTVTIVNPDVSVDITGLSATASVGTATVTADASVSASGLSASPSVGAASITADASINASGVSGSGQVGSVDVNLGTATAPTFGGGSRPKWVYPLELIEQKPAWVKVKGNSAYAEVGTCKSSGFQNVVGTRFLISTPSAQAASGRVRVEAGQNLADEEIAELLLDLMTR